jgi:hypothetical protein
MLLITASRTGTSAKIVSAITWQSGPEHIGISVAGPGPLPLAPDARQGGVARCAPVLRTPLPRTVFAVAAGSDEGSLQE